MKSLIVLTILSSILTGCVTTSDQLSDENILMPMPIPEDGWNTHSSEKKLSTKVQWHKDSETLTLAIFHGKNALTAAEYQEVEKNTFNDNPNWKVKTKHIKSGSTNNYPYDCWLTEVITDNGEIYNLQLYIKGNDAGYLLSKRWIDSTAEANEEMQMWTDYFMTVEVYDPRYPEHQSDKMKNP